MGVSNSSRCLPSEPPSHKPASNRRPCSATGNSIPASFWLLAEVIRDPDLLSRVRETIAKHKLATPPGTLDFDYTSLCNEPLLQSIYAETLRLHVAIFILRASDRRDVELRGWRVPRGEPILVSGFGEQMDPSQWERSDHPEGKPVGEFWAERFLREDGGFSLKGRAGTSWLPYGGGQRMCPGRHFAKVEMIGSLAILLTLFDVEIADKVDGIPGNDMGGFGFGALWPKGRLPVRMRRRDV